MHVWAYAMLDPMASPRCSTSSLVLVGIGCGREERVTRPASPSAAYRSIQIFTHLWETPIAAAMWATNAPAG